MANTVDASKPTAPAPLESAAAPSAVPQLQRTSVARCWWPGQVFWWSMASGLALWAAFPPLGWWPLAWIAPLGWLWLIRMRRLPGRRPYGTVYLTGVVHCLLLYHFIRLPHWSTKIGWVALALYLGLYVWLFVALARVAVHRLRISVIWAAPAVWVGLELIRGHVLSGFSMALLGHTLVSQTLLIQIADLFGAYTVSFFLMLAAAAVARILPCGDQRPVWWPAGVTAAVVAAVVAYGWWREQTVPRTHERPAARVALIQGSIDTIFDLTPEQADRRSVETFTQYQQLTAEARRRWPDVDLVIWPESKFIVSDLIYSTGKPPAVPPGAPPLPTADQQQELIRHYARLAKGLRPGDPDPALFMIVGTQSVVFADGQPKVYNSALLLDPEGNIADRYFKMHRVPFGEYVPLDWLMPWIYRLTPLPGAIVPGERPVVFEVAGLRLAPTICFESTVPHVVRRQLVQLAREGTPADVLVNITDDGWFWGSSCLDLHLACTIFRAVEHHTPALVAANTGLSAWIDGSGRILKKGPRRQTEVLLAEVHPDGRTSLYQRVGDWPAWGCAGFCLLCALWGLASRRRERRSQ